MSRNYRCRVAQTQNLDDLKGNASLRDLPCLIFNFSSQLINNLLWRFMMYSSVPNSYFGISSKLRMLFKTHLFKMLFDNVNLNFTKLDPFFLLDIKTHDCDILCLSLFFLKLSKSYHVQNRHLGICDFATTLLHEAGEYELLWWWLSFGTFNGPGL